MGRLAGTREWSEHSVNCVTGCAHDCRYCYARSMAARFGRCRRRDWHQPRIRWNEVEKGRRKLRGTVMFPTSHDITPDVLAPCLTVLSKLLGAGNQVLLVSKPHYDCLEEVWRLAEPHKSRITFRFTIGSLSDDLLSYWEPGAPSAGERLACLRESHRRGFRTSVSAEPCLDIEGAADLIEECAPYVTDAIWLGKMNRVSSRVQPKSHEARRAVARIQHAQRDEAVLRLYGDFRGNPVVKWKDSIRQTVAQST